MRGLQRKRKNKRVLYSIPSLIILLVITFLLARGALRVMDKEWESRERLEALGERATSLAIREQELKDDIARLQTEEGIKDEIKDRFSVTQEGEYVAIIVDERGISGSIDSLALPWYKRFWSAIIGSK
jgi:type II secretory pathway component PulJ